MTNVRIHENGLSKAPVYDPTAPLLHRSAVTAVEGSDPAKSAGIDTSGYEEARFDVDIGGKGFTSLEVQVLFWSSRLSQWFSGGERLFTGTGRHAKTSCVGVGSLRQWSYETPYRRNLHRVHPRHRPGLH